MSHHSQPLYNAILVFPNQGWLLAAYISLTITLIVSSGIVARRLGHTWRTLTSFKPLTSSWVCDLCTAGVLWVSLAFVIISGTITFAIGTNTLPTCDASVTLCVSVFVLAKVLLYFFFLERSILIRNGGEPEQWLSRFRNLSWVFGTMLFCIGVPCAILLGFSRQFKLVEQNSQPIGCHVSLKPPFAIPVIAWIGVLNFYTLVIIGLKNVQSTKRLARKTVIAIAISGISTVVNLTTLLALKGEHGLECLLCCSIDVAANSLSLAWVTSGAGEATLYPAKQILTDMMIETEEKGSLSPAQSSKSEV